MNLAINGGEPLRKSSYPQWPVFDEEERQKFNEVLESRVWGVGGRQKTEFEKSFVAIKIALKALDLGEGDELIIPRYAFIGTATVVLATNAIPLFVDIDPEIYCLLPLIWRKNNFLY